MQHYSRFLFLLINTITVLTGSKYQSITISFSINSYHQQNSAYWVKLSNQIQSVHVFSTCIELNRIESLIDRYFVMHC